MNDLIIISMAGFITGVTTYLFGFGGGFVVVPFVYRVLSNQSADSESVMHIAIATSTAVMIFNATFATYNNFKQRKIDKNIISPIIYYIALGSLLGALLANKISDYMIRTLFIVYMVVTIIDCIFRKGFFKVQNKKPLSFFATTIGGIFIGSIATLLGVGGSVMTVPLLRRHGSNMVNSVASANPLTLPIAIVGTLVYAFLSPNIISTQYYYLGFVNISILMILIFFGSLGIIIARYIPRIRDDIHSKVYVFLLILVTFAILL